MPAVNSKILQADYNSIRDKVVAVLGNGSANFGYGQEARLVSTAVAEGTNVTINEWANLRFDIINAYKHINGSNPITAEVVAGNTIRYTGNFTPDTGSLDVPQKQYDDWADNITTNRFTVAPSESGETAVVASSRTTAWVSQCQCVIQFYWANANDARYWFNSGGRIRISASRTGGSISTQNTSWTNLLSAAGTQTFGGALPSTGTTPNNGTNWYKTTSTFQTFYTATATGAYTSNNYQLQARCVEPITSNSGGTALRGEIRILFTDGYTDSGAIGPPALNPPPGDDIDGTLTVSVSTVFASNSIMVPSSAVFTVVQPTIAVGAVTGS
jgi:hypothetical protein